MNRGSCVRILKRVTKSRRVDINAMKSRFRYSSKESAFGYVRVCSFHHHLDGWKTIILTTHAITVKSNSTPVVPPRVTKTSVRALLKNALEAFLTKIYFTL